MAALKIKVQLISPKWFYITLAVLLLSACSTEELVGHGRMTPTDPKILSGETLVLNCTLKSVGRYNASAIYFQYGSKKEPKKYVRVLNAYTAQLRKPNVTRAKHTKGTHYYCYIPQPDGLVGHQSVIVADIPKKPNITHCRVYNWESMRCWWKPAKQDTGMTTNTTLYWSILENRNHCPHVEPRPNACTWKHMDGRDSFKEGMTYHMYVEAVNDLASNISKAITVDTSKIVIPNKVQNLNKCAGVQKSATKICIAWTTPTPQKLKELLYTITYRSQWEKMDKAKTVNKSTAHESINYTLEGLTPYTNYTIEVKCKPVVEGFYSQKRTIFLKTAADVPGGLPEVAAGSFELTPQRKDVTIYWKKLHKSLWQGHHLSYRISFRKAGTSDWMPLKAHSSYFHHKITSYDLKNFAFEIKVDAKNERGFNESLVPQIVFIDRETPVMPMPIAIGKDREVTVNWTAVAGAADYTLYWCENIGQRCDRNSKLDWVNLGNDSTSHTVYLTNSHKFLFAVSVQKRTESGRVASSGMKWATCTYNAGTELLAPTKIVFPSHQKSGSLSLEWNHPGCKSGYIQQYAIAYWLQEDEDCTEDKVITDGEGVRYKSVESSKKEYTIENLEPYKTYCVKMRSETPYLYQPSVWTKPLSKEVIQTGLSEVALGLIIFAGIILFFFIVIGLLTIVRKIKRSISRGLQGPEVISPDHIRNRQILDEDNSDLGVPYSRPEITDTVRLLTEDNVKNQELEKTGGSLVAGARAEAIRVGLDIRSGAVYCDKPSASCRSTCDSAIGNSVSSTATDGTDISSLHSSLPPVTPPSASGDVFPKDSPFTKLQPSEPIHEVPEIGDEISSYSRQAMAPSGKESPLRVCLSPVKESPGYFGFDNSADSDGIPAKSIDQMYGDVQNANSGEILPDSEQMDSGHGIPLQPMPDYSVLGSENPLKNSRGSDHQVDIEKPDIKMHKMRKSASPSKQSPGTYVQGSNTGESYTDDDYSKIATNQDPFQSPRGLFVSLPNSDYVTAPESTMPINARAVGIPNRNNGNNNDVRSLPVAATGAALQNGEQLVQKSPEKKQKSNLRSSPAQRPEDTHKPVPPTSPVLTETPDVVECKQAEPENDEAKMSEAVQELSNSKPPSRQSVDKVGQEGQTDLPGGNVRPSPASCSYVAIPSEANQPTQHSHSSNPNIQAPPTKYKQPPQNLDYVQSPPDIPASQSLSPRGNPSSYVQAPPVGGYVQAPPVTVSDSPAQNHEYPGEKQNERKPSKDESYPEKSRYSPNIKDSGGQPVGPEDAGQSPLTAGQGAQPGAYVYIPHPEARSGDSNLAPEDDARPRVQGNGGRPNISGYVPHDSVPRKKDSDVSLPEDSAQNRLHPAKSDTFSGNKADGQDNGYLPHHDVDTEKPHRDRRKNVGVDSNKEGSSSPPPDHGGATGAEGMNGRAVAEPLVNNNAVAASASGYVPHTNDPQGHLPVSQAAGTEDNMHSDQVGPSKAAAVTQMPNGYVALT